MNSPSLFKIKHALVDVMEVLDNLVLASQKLELEGLAREIEDAADKVADAHEYLQQRIRAEEASRTRSL